MPIQWQNREMQLRLGFEPNKTWRLPTNRWTSANITRRLPMASSADIRELYAPHLNMANAYWEGFKTIQQDPSMTTMTKVVWSLSKPTIIWMRLHPPV